MAIVVIVAIVVIDEGDDAGMRGRFFYEQIAHESVIHGKYERV